MIPAWGYSMIAMCIAAAIIGYIAAWAMDEWRNL